MCFSFVFRRAFDCWCGDMGRKHGIVHTQTTTHKSERQVIAELLSELVEQPFYDELRTQQQLGYLVFSGVLIFVFVVNALDVGVCVCVCGVLRGIPPSAALHSTNRAARHGARPVAGLHRAVHRGRPPGKISEKGDCVLGIVVSILLLLYHVEKGIRT